MTVSSSLHQQAQGREHAVRHFAVQRLVFHHQHPAAQARHTANRRSGRVRSSNACSALVAATAQRLVQLHQAQRFRELRVERPVGRSRRGRKADEAHETDDARLRRSPCGAHLLQQTGGLAVRQRVINHDRVVGRSTQLRQSSRERRRFRGSPAPLAHCLGSESARRRVVIHYQRAQAIEARQCRCLCQRIAERGRQLEEESGAGTRCADQRQPPAQQLDDLPGDGQAEARAAEAPGSRCILLREFLEDA